jgi:hypothetical protein
VPAPDAEGWRIVYAETPQGQVSWHIGSRDADLFADFPTAPVAGWDGHSTDEKYRRLAALAAPPEPTLPGVVCLCGSTRFYEAFQQANYDLTMAGKIVLSVGFYPHSKAVHGHGEGIGHDSTEKVALDELHLRKIDLADEVLVLNVGGYIGESTRREIAYAERTDKPVRYLEPTAALRAEATE